MIPVTKPFLPPQKKYEEYLNGIWSREYLTNNGPLVQQLEDKLKKYLDVTCLNYVSNGTIALQIAIKALGLKGEIITTPFSYVATTSSIVWEGCEPVFVDIDSSTLNIDPNLIENAITNKTSAILATHVFGNPCDIEAIKVIAEQYGLKVIYDAAHCFGTNHRGKSVYNYGDISTASFHATKLFHTIEGGGIFTKDTDLNKRVGYMRNFGHDGFGKFNGVGINGKNSEFHAVMGLCILNYMDEILKKRKKQFLFYNQCLNSNLNIKTQKINKKSTYNYSYYPLIFENEKITLEILNKLEESGISPRRYFYPSLSSLSYVDGKCRNSDDVSKRILCLPLYHYLSTKDQVRISDIVSKYENYV